MTETKATADELIAEIRKIRCEKEEILEEVRALRAQLSSEMEKGFQLVKKTSQNMTEMEDNKSAAGNDKDSPNNLMSEIQQLRSEMKSKHADVLEKLQSIENLVSKDQTDFSTETKDAVGFTVSSSSLSLNNPTERNAEIGKSFVLKHVFENMEEECEKEEWNVSGEEEHFGVNWFIRLKHRDNNLQFFLRVDHQGDNWEIETEHELKIMAPTKPDFSKNGSHCFKKSSGYGCPDFLDWEEMKNNYLVDGNLTAEAHVKIIKTRGLRKEKFRNFDESVKEVSDIVLVVKDRRFYVNRTFLAAQSSFFKALLLGNFFESKKSEVTLTGIDLEDFHFFLEVLYGELAIDESNVEGIALLADMYDAPTAIRRCEEFIMKASNKTLKRKLQMADQYHLEVLKKKCFSKIKTLSDLQSVVPNNIKQLEHSTISALLEKAISIGES